MALKIDNSSAALWGLLLALVGPEQLGLFEEPDAQLGGRCIHSLHRLLSSRGLEAVSDSSKSQAPSCLVPTLTPFLQQIFTDASDVQTLSWASHYGDA